MTVKILIASKNKNKVKELEKVLLPFGNIIFLKDWEDEHGPLIEPPEDGNSFLENAFLKASYYAKKTSLNTIADDSGLSVLALNHAPGIHSARYGGKHLTDEQRCQKLLQDLKDKTDLRAYFTSTLVLCKTNQKYLSWTGILKGEITFQNKGENGFGYDPIFYYPPLSMTLAQISTEQKNIISHRAQAAQKLLDDKNKISKFLEN